MKTVNKWIEHVVRDFLQERENRATVICNTILFGLGGSGGGDGSGDDGMRNRNYTVNITDKMYWKIGPREYFRC